MTKIVDWDVKPQHNQPNSSWKIGLCRIVSLAPIFFWTLGCTGLSPLHHIFHWNIGLCRIVSLAPYFVIGTLGHAGLSPLHHIFDGNIWLCSIVSLAPSFLYLNIGSCRIVTLAPYFFLLGCAGLTPLHHIFYWNIGSCRIELHWAQETHLGVSQFWMSSISGHFLIKSSENINRWSLWVMKHERLLFLHLTAHWHEIKC